MLTLDEYCELMGGEELSLEQLRAQFAEFDLDGNGVVDRAELVRAALIDVLVHARTRVLVISDHEIDAAAVRAEILDWLGRLPLPA